MSRLEELQAKYEVPLELDPKPFECYCGDPTCDRYKYTPMRASARSDLPFNPRPQYEQSIEVYQAAWERGAMR